MAFPRSNLRMFDSRALQVDPGSSSSATPAVTPVPTTMPDGMPTLAPSIPPVMIGTTCSNGIPGVESENGKTCCALYCIECAGVGCSGRGNSTDCCATEIATFSQDCALSGSAPCFITVEPPPELEHSLVYFTIFFVIPFLIIVLLCNVSPPRWLRCWRRRKDSDELSPEDAEAATAHLRGHNTSPRRAPRPPTPQEKSVEMGEAQAPAVGGGSATL